MPPPFSAAFSVSPTPHRTARRGHPTCGEQLGLLRCGLWHGRHHEGGAAQQGHEAEPWRSMKPNRWGGGHLGMLSEVGAGWIELFRCVRRRTISRLLVLHVQCV